MLQVNQINVEKLKEMLDKKEGFKLIDCREEDEYEKCRIEGSTLIPLSQFQDRGPKELSKDDQIVIHCHHGGRSQQACELLVSQGYKNVTNVAGGIHEWSVQIDSKVPQY